MYLGVNWRSRVLPQSNVVRGLSLIPRDFPSLPRCRPHFPPRLPPRLPPRARFSTAPTTLAIIPTSPPPSGLVDRLAKVPVQPHGARESALLKPERAFPSERQTHQEKVKRHRAGAGIESRRKRRLELGLPETGDWRETLALLVAATQPEVVENAVRISIPADAAHQLLALGDRKDGDGAAWAVQTRNTGCVIKRVRPDREGGDEGEGEGKGEGGDHCVTLSGTRAQVDKAVSEIVSLEGRVTVVYPSDASATAAKGEVMPRVPTVPRFPGEVNFPYRPQRLTTRADQVPRPAEWTKESFEKYVAALTLGRLPRGQKHKLYTAGASHERAVVNELWSAFNDPAAFPFISDAALKAAFQYMSRGQTFNAHLQTVFSNLRKAGRRFDSQTYDMLLENAVKAKHLAEFNHLLRQMVKQNLRPTVWTWLLFLRIIESEEVKRYILFYMHDKELTYIPGFINLLAKEMAEYDAHRAVHLGQDMEAFVASQNALYGPEWLSTRSGNSILHVLGRHGKVDGMFQFLEFMFASEKARPDMVTLNTIINHCNMLAVKKRAIQCLALFERHHPQLAPSDMVYDQLFKMAELGRMPHMLGAVLRCALLADKTTYYMRRRAVRLMTEERLAARLLKRLRVAPPNGSQSLVTNPLDGSDPLIKFVEDLLLCDVRRSGQDLPVKYEGAGPGANDASVGKDWQVFYKIKRHVWEPTMPLSEMLESARVRDEALIRTAREGGELDLQPMELFRVIRLDDTPSGAVDLRAKDGSPEHDGSNDAKVSLEGAKPDDAAEKLLFRRTLAEGGRIGPLMNKLKRKIAIAREEKIKPPGIKPGEDGKEPAAAVPLEK